MTKSILHCFVACLCFLALANCGLLKDTNSDFIIRVSGTEGLRFSGHYSLVGTKELPEPVHAHAAIPGEYKGKGVTALCSFRKLTVKGTLKVEILKDGNKHPLWFYFPQSTNPAKEHHYRPNHGEDFP